MCGIAGIWGECDEGLVRDWMAQLTHRGPDARGLHCGRWGTLGHTRLAIMDPAGGDQPIYGADDGRAIVANGEIYNHPRLHAALAPQYPYRTRSDSESALHLYDRDGPAAVAALDGMFALAIGDGPHLVLARDPIGIKPLYTGRRGDALVFASELKCLAGRCEDVQEFPPGTRFHSRDGFETYYAVPDGPPNDELPLEQHLAAVRQTLEAAVAKRLMSDVPVGAFLSGGLDSSIIAALARSHVDELHTFSVGLAGSPDLLAARRVAEHLDTIHHECVLAPEEALEALPQVVQAMETYDPDLVRSGLPCWFVSEAAARHVKVVLTGEGADELFAGYRYYLDYERPEALHAELCRSVAGLHNMNLQRVDRLTMAHSLEARVPFLDVAMVDVGLRVPPRYKIVPDAQGRRIEKWILRAACEDLLPPQIVWRTKSQFDEGSGSAELLADSMERWLTPEQSAAYAEAHPRAALPNREACVYHMLLSEALPGAGAVLDAMTLWAQRPADA